MTRCRKSTIKGTALIQYTSPIRDQAPSGIIVGFVACALMALLVLGGALYAQQRNQLRNQIVNSQTHQLYCDLANLEREHLPLRMQAEMVLFCAARPFAKP